MPTLRDALHSPAARLTAAMSALFAGLGVLLPFLSAWLAEERGLHGVQIGLVISAPALIRGLTAPLIGAWADSLPDRRLALRALSLTGLCAFVLFFQVRGFLALVLVSFVATSLVNAMTPLIEGALLRSSVAGPLPYGIARGIGSAAFIVGNLGGGYLIARLGTSALPGAVLAAYALVAVVCWTALAREPAAPGPDFRGRVVEVLRLTRHPPFVRLLVAAGLIQSAHAFYYGFSALLWQAQGLGSDTIGALWAFGVIVEIAFLWTLPRIERRVSPELLLWIGALGGIARWLALGLAPALPWLWPVQALHALSFAAAHVGALRMVQRDAPPEVANGAQTLYAGAVGGTLTGLATLGSGALYEAIDVEGYFVMAALAAASVLFLARPR